MTLFQIHISIIVNSLLCFTYSISCSEKKKFWNRTARCYTTLHAISFRLLLRRWRCQTISVSTIPMVLGGESCCIGNSYSPIKSCPALRFGEDTLASPQRDNKTRTESNLPMNKLSRLKVAKHHKYFFDFYSKIKFWKIIWLYFSDMVLL